MIEEETGRHDRHHADGCGQTRARLRVRARTARARSHSDSGYTLIEMLVAMVVFGVLLSMGVPQFQQSLEQSRADVAGANLRAIWSAQRLYWLENRTYAPDLTTLLSANLIDPSLPTATAPYTYQVASSSDSWFTATATRTGSSFWSGTFTIAADGTFSGRSSNPGGKSPSSGVPVRPSEYFLFPQRVPAPKPCTDCTGLASPGVPMRETTRSLATRIDEATRCSKSRSRSRSWGSAWRACARSS